MPSVFRSPLLRGTFLLALGVSATAMYAAAPGAVVSNTPAVDFRLDGTFVPAADFRYRTEGVSSSADAADDERASLAGEGSGEGSGEGQPGYGRRRSYGRSRYQDRMHNSDGSTKIAFVAGGGANIPVANTAKYYTLSYGVLAGAGINFSRRFGILGEFHYDHAGLTGGAINSEYNNLVGLGASASDLSGFDANSHIIALTVDPVINFADSHSKVGAYVTGGVGYYHKTTNFTIPELGEACGSFFCYTYSSNVNIDSYAVNAFGANLGAGISYRISEFSSERLFAEARYHWLDVGNNNTPEFFPYNKRNSEYIPVMVGIRF